MQVAVRHAAVYPYAHDYIRRSSDDLDRARPCTTDTLAVRLRWASPIHVRYRISGDTYPLLMSHNASR